MTERDMIIDWLRDRGDLYEDVHHCTPKWRIFLRAAMRFNMAAFRYAAACIERGEHLALADEQERAAKGMSARQGESAVDAGDAP